MIFVTKPRIKSLKFWRATRLQVKLTVNKVAKDFTEKKFSEWFSRQISIGLENGQELEDIEIDYRLSVLKPCTQRGWYQSMIKLVAQKVKPS